jgi:hypothetical protein
MTIHITTTIARLAAGLAANGCESAGAATTTTTIITTTTVTAVAGNLAQAGRLLDQPPQLSRGAPPSMWLAHALRCRGPVAVL